MRLIMPNSRRKGHQFERETAAFYRGVLEGFVCGEIKRGLQTRDGSEVPDVVIENLPGMWIECKIRKKIALYEWFNKALKDSPDGSEVIMHIRADGEKPLIVMGIETWAELLISSMMVNYRIFD